MVTKTPNSSRKQAHSLGLLAMQAGVRDEGELMRLIRFGVISQSRIDLALPLLEEAANSLADGRPQDAKPLLTAVRRALRINS